MVTNQQGTLKTDKSPGRAYLEQLQGERLAAAARKQRPQRRQHARPHAAGQHRAHARIHAVPRQPWVFRGAAERHQGAPRAVWRRHAALQQAITSAGKLIGRQSCGK